MADIRVRWNGAFQSSDQLKTCKNKVDAIANRVSRVQTSSVFYSNGLSQYRRIIQNAARELQQEGSALYSLQNSLDHIIRTYQETEKKLSNRQQKRPPSKKGGNTSTDSSKKYKTDWKKLIFDSAGEFGVFGGVVSLIGKVITAGWKEDWIKAALKSSKELTKMVGKIAGVVKAGGIRAEWSDLWKPKKYTTGYFWAKDATTAAKVKVVTKWAGAAISAATFGYENYKRVGKGEITAFEAGLATVASTATDVGMGIGIGAGVAAIGAAVGAPAIAVGLATVGVTWGVNEVCKWAFGKDVAHAVGDAAVNVARKAGSWAADLGNRVSDGVSKAKKKISTLWGNTIGRLSYVW